jgi:hypothetical protein
MRRFVVPGRQNWALGVSIVRNVVTVAFAAAVLSAASNACAGDRHTKQSTASSASVRAAAQSKAHSGNMERKCVIMSCGTPWCFSVKR